MTAHLVSYGRVSHQGLFAAGREANRRDWASLNAGPPDAFGLPRLRHKYFSAEASPHFGRMDILCKLGLGAAELCLQGDTLAGINREEIAIVGGTQLGCLEVDAQYHETLIEGGPTGASPALFVYTLPSMFVGEIAIRFGLRGRCTLLSAGGRTARTALTAGLRLIEKGRAPAALVVYADALGPAARWLSPRPAVETLGCAWLLTRQGLGPAMMELPAADSNAEFVRMMEAYIPR